MTQPRLTRDVLAILGPQTQLPSPLVLRIDSVTPIAAGVNRVKLICSDGVDACTAMPSSELCKETKFTQMENHIISVIEGKVVMAGATPMLFFTKLSDHGPAPAAPPRVRAAAGAGAGASPDNWPPEVKIADLGMHIFNGGRNLTVRGRVMNLSEPIPYAKGNGGARCLFDLVDASGTKISCVFFNEVIHKVRAIVSEGAVIRMTRFDIDNFRNTTQIKLSMFTSIEVIRSDSEEAKSIPMHEACVLTPLSAVRELPIGEPMNVLGIVTAASEVKTIMVRDRTETRYLRNFTIIDQSGVSVDVTIWDNPPKGESKAEVKSRLHSIAYTKDSFPILLVRGCTIRERTHSTGSGAEGAGGVGSISRSLSVNFHPMSVVLNPPADIATGEQEELRKWFTDKDIREIYAGFESLSGEASFGGGPATDENKALGRGRDGRIALAEVARVGLGRKMGHKDYFTECLRISTFHNMHEPPWYTACPTCNRKVAEHASGSMVCDACKEIVAKPVLKFNLQVDLHDFSGSITRVRLFNEAAEQLLGKTAEEMNVLRELDTKTSKAAYDAVFNEKRLTPLVMRICATPERPMAGGGAGGDLRMNYQVMAGSTFKVDYAHETKLLQERIAYFMRMDEERKLPSDTAAADPDVAQDEEGGLPAPGGRLPLEEEEGDDGDITME